MKNTIKAGKMLQPSRPRVLPQHALASVIGGHDGTIISQNAIPEGIQGSGK